MILAGAVALHMKYNADEEKRREDGRKAKMRAPSQPKPRRHSDWDEQESIAALGRIIVLLDSALDCEDTTSHGNNQAR